jgi:hypothetical protein
MPAVAADVYGTADSPAGVANVPPLLHASDGTGMLGWTLLHAARNEGIWVSLPGRSDAAHVPSSMGPHGARRARGPVLFKYWIDDAVPSTLMVSALLLKVLGLLLRSAGRLRWGGGLTAG